jgi:hypothetical protein
MIVSLLPAVTRDLNVGLPVVVHLVTTFSLAYNISALVMAVLISGLERRRLLALAMAGFSISDLLAALAPGYAGPLARLLLALFAASFVQVAREYAAALGGPERRGRGLSMVTNGLTLAIIGGVPSGMMVGEGYDPERGVAGSVLMQVMNNAGAQTHEPTHPICRHDCDASHCVHRDGNTRSLAWPKARRTTFSACARSAGDCQQAAGSPGQFAARPSWSIFCDRAG